MDIYCTQLGMMSGLTYCLTVNDGLPCRNTIGCWQERIEIRQILERVFTKEELERSLGGPLKTRIERLIESIRAVGKEE